MIFKSSIDKYKLGVIGVGNMGEACLKGFLKSKVFPKENLFASNRSERKLEQVKEKYGINTFKTNEELINNCDIILIAVKPQDIYELLEPLASSFQKHHTVLSLSAGIPLETLHKWLPYTENIIRVMPNTPVSIFEGVIAYSMKEREKKPFLAELVEKLFQPLGKVLFAESSEALKAFTVACSSGIGFIYEIMQYWQEWLEERDFSPESARQIVLQTFLGATLLAQKNNVPLSKLQKQVTSKKGVTKTGLDSIRELELERILWISLEKAALRESQLAHIKGGSQS